MIDIDDLTEDVCENTTRIQNLEKQVNGMKFLITFMAIACVTALLLTYSAVA